jgi:ectoine hydroxylase-related dioxygenase (phytanoyl-CoA dioxygenase family)
MARGLSQLEVDHFRRTGYLAIPAIFEGVSLSILGDAIDRQAASPIDRCACDNMGRATRIYGLIDRDVLFFQCLSSDEIVRPLISLLGPNIVLATNRHNLANIVYPGLEKDRLHRDILQWSRSMITTIIYLDDATTENGCTHIIPGSQYFPFVERPNNGGTWLDEHTQFRGSEFQELPVPLPAGSVLFLDSLTFHRAGSNQTKAPRRAIIAAYHSVDELALSEDPNKVLVSGEWIQRGNMGSRPIT